jgi:hypothetical protein
LIAVIIVALAGAVETALRRRLKRPPVVKAVPRCDTSPVSIVREAPEPNEASHAFRVETHPGQHVVVVTEART